MLTLLIVIVGLTLAPGSAPAVSTEREPFRRVAAPRDAEIRLFVDLVNRHRAKIGCRPLIWDERLAAVARRHSKDMARRHFFDHTNPDGEGPFDRMSDAGIDYRAAAENLAMGDLTGRTVFEGWLGSRGHRRNLEDCEYTHHGVGVYENHWTHVFVRYATEPPSSRRRTKSGTLPS